MDKTKLEAFIKTERNKNSGEIRRTMRKLGEQISYHADIFGIDLTAEVIQFLKNRESDRT